MANKKDILVKTGSNNYPIVFSDHKRQVARIVSDTGRAVIISNPNVYALHGRALINRLLPGRLETIPIMIGDGEKYKSQLTVNRLYDHLFDIRMGRRDTIIAFGGGVVGDTAGMVAATYMRGVNFIQVPTTLLAMVDSSIGGKVGVNHKLGKNLLGAFYQPRAVLIDPFWLGTLGHREMLEGLGEIIKVGFLSSRKFLTEAVECDPESLFRHPKRLQYLVREAARFKADIVSRDTCDHGVRAILNFGHTFGHSIEKAEGLRRYRHGAAVLAGMIGALHLSQTVGKLSLPAMKRYLGLLESLVAELPPLKKELNDYFSPMFVDKKSNNGCLRFVLLDRIGRPTVKTVKSERAVLEAIGFMKEFVNNRSIR
ncbi:MAG: 3-dehydroquinate synthase [FCB group bacterium]|nr:3-dehydroquinate synthase [FCB group bacterium]